MAPARWGRTTRHRRGPAHALSELVADEGVPRRSAQLRAEARAEGGAARAAGLVEEMLG
ncbi:hypothetical protein ACFVW5_29340 [Streptomyces sp. NPDC058232]|uniref:hypothetical protein n=1 Tax=Streptomyces sp. NPDC058232 TaxID=3346393 RepID=UPI0036E28E65